MLKQPFPRRKNRHPECRLPPGTLKGHWRASGNERKASHDRLRGNLPPLRNHTHPALPPSFCCIPSFPFLHIGPLLSFSFGDHTPATTPGSRTRIREYAGISHRRPIRGPDIGHVSDNRPGSKICVREEAGLRDTCPRRGRELGRVFKVRPEPAPSW